MELETSRATQNSVGDQGLFGAGGGQEALNYNVVPVQPGQQYNSFGAPLAGSAASGGSTGQAGGHVDVRDNHGDHMSRSEMAVVRAFFDEIMKPGKQRQTWEYTDGPNDVECDDVDGRDGGGGDGNRTPRAR